jgi:UTP-glucose-1-phosphate uridylyltransferase
MGYLKTVVDFACEHPDLGEQFKTFLKERVESF